jgi:hypothetical protein
MDDDFRLFVAVVVLVEGEVLAIVGSHHFEGSRVSWKISNGSLGSGKTVSAWNSISLVVQPHRDFLVGIVVRYWESFVAIHLWEIDDLRVSIAVGEEHPRLTVVGIVAFDVADIRAVSCWVQQVNFELLGGTKLKVTVKLIKMSINCNSTNQLPERIRHCCLLYRNVAINWQAAATFMSIKEINLSLKEGQLLALESRFDDFSTPRTLKMCVNAVGLLDGKQTHRIAR